MTIDKTLLAVKQLIEDASEVTYPNLDGIPVLITTEDEEKTYPCILVTDTGAEEHEVLRGVFTVGVDVQINTIPNDDAADGTTEAQHQAISSNLYDLLGDVASITALDAYEGLTVFDIRGSEPANEREDGRNATTISQEITCCQST
jgi:hypothetical protein